MPGAVQKDVTSDRVQDAASDLLARSDVARILGVSPTTVTRWAARAASPAVSPSVGNHRFERSLVEQIRDRMMRAKRPSLTSRAAPDRPATDPLDRAGPASR